MCQQHVVLLALTTTMSWQLFAVSVDVHADKLTVIPYHILVVTSLCSVPIFYIIFTSLSAAG